MVASLRTARKGPVRVRVMDTVSHSTAILGKRPPGGGSHLGDGKQVPGPLPGEGSDRQLAGPGSPRLGRLGSHP